MILGKEDIEEFESAWRGCVPADDPDQVREFLGWLAENPQVIMSSGLQEYVARCDRPGFDLLRQFCGVESDIPLFRTLDGSWVYVASCGESVKQEWEVYRIDALISAVEEYLDSLNEAEFDSLEQLDIDDFDSTRASIGTFDSIVKSAWKLVDNPMVDPTSFVSPRLWTPGNQAGEKVLLEASSVGIIRQLQLQKTELADIHWRSFEEIVAEILRSQGMEIHLVRENPQGGRDIVGRTKMAATGEVLTIAVEVKHKSYVDRPDVQLAMQQNSRFPALMFVTSGTFSSGVIREAKTPESRMRLFLKDGVAIRDLIRRYRL